MLNHALDPGDCNLRDGPANHAKPAAADLDGLPPVQYLILETLAARWRLGEQSWPFPKRLQPALSALRSRGLISYQYGGLPGQIWASLSETGLDALLRDSYVPPAERPGDLGYTAPCTWARWTWPLWVPGNVREQVEAFWAEEYGRGPRAWLNDISSTGAPPLGAVVTLGNGFGTNPPPVTGRYVHAWNNIGRLVLDGGTVVCTSFNSRDGGW